MVLEDIEIVEHQADPSHDVVNSTAN